MNPTATLHRQHVAEASTRALPAWRTNRIFAYIEKNLSMRVNLEELGGLVGLSPARLSRVFKGRFGVTLRFYVSCRRIVMAQNLMLMTDAPLKDIALQCGMSDQAHFTRVFHTLVGETPGHWRRRQSQARGESHVG